LLSGTFGRAASRLKRIATDTHLTQRSEYADGVPGTLKNALDWIVGSGEIIDKPVALVNASPRATHAQASLSALAEAAANTRWSV
jgi:NAD(P)H-dependent FMN reductase